MEINGLTLTQFRACALLVSAERYAGNVRVHQDAHGRPDSKDGTHRCTARLTVAEAGGPGSRTTASGRRGPYACWHAYRDVLAEVFRRYPDAVIRAGHGWRVTYRGLTGFLATYPGTANVVIGSEASPVTMPELCECTEERENEREPAGYQHYTEADFESDAFGSRATEVAAEYRRQRDAREQDDTWSRYNNPGYVSLAVKRASRAYAASAELLGEGDKPADPWVFGPEYTPADDPHRNQGLYLRLSQ